MNMKDIDHCVIDRAIRHIEAGSYRYTCHALHDASHGEAWGFDGYKENPICILYKEACKLPPKRKDRTFSMPWWWGRSSGTVKARVAALEQFRQQVLEAKARAELK
jgi:hypothetical protein